jgi:5-methylcytosine-specific restriction endonuclease McrA
MTRKRFNGRLEDLGVFKRRRRCSQSCANTRTENLSRDTHHWRARQHRSRVCEECGTGVGLHVHHKDRNPTNNDPANLQTLCASCHLKLHWREDREKRLAAMRRRQVAS